ncbi:MAG: beta-glucosidase [Phycisphaeraceae bacterium]|nr:beta-glucosidase [Phycisphaeraceae bacterium]
MAFAQGFVWGAAAASYQVEGGHDADGKGPSVWDMMCRWPGKINKGDTGRIACDHYHRHIEDADIMQSLGIQAYRLSLSWPRIIPDGDGKPNEAGLAFYDRLVDDLLARDIQPWVTLFHWDYPLSLFYRGGWLNRDSVEWFARYTEVVAKRLGDRVTHWMTLNEPQCFIGLGHMDGVHAPGIKLAFREILLAAHHTLMAHGRAVRVLRDSAKAKPTIGWAPVGIIRYPAGNDPANIEAARRATFTTDEKHCWNNTWFNDPVIFGRYPEDALKAFEGDVPEHDERDLAVMHQPLDFLGVNIYNGLPVEADDSPRGWREVQRKPGFPTTHFDWPIEPDSLYWGPRFLHERYQLPIYITENGLSSTDWVDLDGRVRDYNRIDFTRRYLLRLADAIKDGVPVNGYFHWSIMDNFEWAEGYRHRFGLVHVDFATQKRTIKESGHWYKTVIHTNGDHLNNPPE